MFSGVFNQHEKVTVYTKDLSGRGQSANETVIKAFGLNSASDYVGRTDMDLPGQNLYAPSWIKNDQRILITGIGEMLFELCHCSGTLQWFRSYKTPLLGHSGKIIGISGVSMMISDASLIPLTKQQTACLKNLALGMTMKQIGDALGLSAKTVEHYLDTVKVKLNCQSRSDLVVQAIERGLVGFF